MQSATVELRQKTSHRILALALIAASFAVLISALYANIWNGDFICYWRAATSLQANGNPYDSSTLLAIEQAHGVRVPFIMRNPPWALFLVAPLAWFSAKTAALLWICALIAAAIISVRSLQYETRISPFIFLFTPLLVCARLGQTATFLLLGVAIFLRYERTRPFVAGLALILPALKPHLFLLLWPLLILDCLRRRHFKLLAGAATSFASACAIALILDHHPWSHYLVATHSEHIEAEYIPTIACTLRMLLAPTRIWVQFVPALIGIAWAIQHFRASLIWRDHGPLLIAVSVLVAPYSWPTDQVLMLPLVLYVIHDASKRGLAILGGLNLLAYGVYCAFASMHSPAHLWTAPVWICWSHWVMRQRAIYAMKTNDPPERRLCTIENTSAARQAVPELLF